MTAGSRRSNYMDWFLTIISGGQTGVDRAALDFALEHGLSHGGWCPAGRKAEDGIIPGRYRLRETSSDDYAERTRANVRDSDATVIFSIASELSGGSRATFDLARSLARPVLHLHAEVANPAGELTAFLRCNRVAKLNVAGPRASSEPLAAEFAGQVLREALRPDG